MISQELHAEEFLDWRKKQLLKGGRAVDFDWLIEIAGGLNWSDLQLLLIDRSRCLKLDQSLEELGSLWQRHLDDRMPLQYIVGRCPWRDFELEVTPAALIPRQETEILIEVALEKFDPGFSEVWADLGTGSGALAVALARSFPAAIGHAVDCSEDALALARRNLELLAPETKVSFHQGSWWSPLKPWWGSFSLVIANPPYIPSSVMEELEPIVREQEPFSALWGGDDGLMASRAIIDQAMQGLAKDGWLLLEHHHDQSDSVLELMIRSGLKEVDFQTDLQGIKRFAFGRHP